MHAKIQPKKSRKSARAAAARRALTLVDAGWQTPAFLAAIDASPDSIYITDPRTLRFLYVNETAYRMHGCTRDEFLKLSPMETLSKSRDELKRTYQRLIASGHHGETMEFLGVSKDGRRGWFEGHRRAVCLGGRWVIVTIARDITRRRRAERSLQRLGRMYAALSATNEVIMRAESPQELFQGVCDAAVHHGKFINAAVLVPDGDNGFAKIIALAGDQRLRRARLAVRPDVPEGLGPVGIAFQTCASSVSNDFLNDERTRAWHRQAQSMGIAGSAGVPLLRDDQVIGVLLFHSSERRAFGDEIVGLLERMAQNIVFALDNFDREAQRQEAVSRERFTRMYAALSATNEALLRAKSVDDLYQRACDAAVHGGRFSATAVVLPIPGSSRGRVAGVSGAGAQRLREAQLSLDTSTPEGSAALGTAFATKRPVAINDYQNDERTKLWHDMAKKMGIGSNAAVPLLRDDKVIGVLLLYSAEKNAFDQQIFRLLDRMAENVVFALENFEREAERRRSEQATLRLKRMYAALSATNEAILHAASTNDLYQLVCDAVAARGGRFLAALLFVAQPGDVWMKLAAKSSKTDSKVLRDMHVSTDPAHPEGRGLTSEAFRSQQPQICNDYRNDPRGRPWRSLIEKSEIRSIASIPILQNGHSIGALTMYARELDSFDDETVTLLQRITENLAFALDNFEREAERERSEIALRESESRFRALTELSSDWYWELDTDLRFSRLEGRSDVVDGATLKRCLGNHPWGLGLEVDGGWNEHQETLQSRKAFRDFLHYRPQANGNRIYYTASGEPMFDTTGHFVGYRGVARDVTQQVLAEQRIQYLATHDGLTALPNRPMFGQMLNHAIESARRYRRQFAVLFIDLDRFKFINDTLGHEAGDLLLQEMAKRLSHTLRASDIIARFGGDEFVVLLPEIKDATEVAAVANKILAALIQPIHVAEQECRVSASIGISTFPGDAQDEQSLMKNADLAMYLAKAEGKNNYQFYSQEIRTEARERLILENNLRRALEQDEFFLHYQPKVNLQTGAITGVEALLRWHNPELGSVPPDKFIPLAEETGLIVPIGRWVLRSACAQGVEWQRQGLPGVCIAVNLSARQFGDDNLIADITAALADSGMSPSLLELEITEGMVMQNPERTIEKLNRIREMGVQLAIDDFGTGYSSLAQLKRFPIDTLKVDRSFIDDIPRDTEDVAITEAIIAMAKSLELVVVAEGVETREQMEFLRVQGCDEMQGYYFSRPIAPEQLAALLRRHEASPGVTMLSGKPPGK